MSFNLTGLNARVRGGEITIKIEDSHPLIQVCQNIPWEELADIVTPDLKKTKKGFWNLGRPLKIRSHLGAYFLQKMFDMTDRGTEYGIRDNAAYQIFCGKNVVSKWKAPDHTKIEEFRSRLSPETQRMLANWISKVAVKLGLANPKEMDIDSTIQEANMSYPSDANLMVKLADKSSKVITAIKEMIEGIPDISVGTKKIKNKARAYFFSRRKKDNRAKIIKELWSLVSKNVLPVIEICESLSLTQVQELPWNIKLSVQQIREKGRQYLSDVDYWLEKGKVKTGKTLAFHLNEVACFNKGKLGKMREFGRAFQLGRLSGNFLVVGECTSVKMDDKQSVKPMIETHATLFGADTLEGV